MITFRISAPLRQAIQFRSFVRSSLIGYYFLILTGKILVSIPNVTFKQERVPSLNPLSRQLLRSIIDLSIIVVIDNNKVFVFEILIIIL